MSAEWHARQLLLIASEPGPAGNILSLSGRSILSDFSSNGGAAPAAGGADATPNRTTSGSRLRRIENSPSYCNEFDRFDDISHEAGRIPIRHVGLRHAVAIGAADRQTVRSRRRQF